MRETSLATPWSHAMGLSVPILNAPMGGVAGGRLAAAVSASGGLGMIGAGSAGTVAYLSAEVEHPRRDDVPFGIGLVEWVVRRDPSLLDTALEALPTLLSVSFGEDWWWVERAQDAEVVTATQVFDVEQARRAEDAGVDVIVARGAEGGGHGEATVGTLPLLEGVLDAVNVPVLAAGGIATARGLAAVLAAGASGAWLGTAFAACRESLADEFARQALLRATETDTVTTDVFDVALGYPWPSRFGERVLRNDFWTRWRDHADNLVDDFDARASLLRAIAAADYRFAPIDAGQGVGSITDVQSAAALINRLSTGAARLFGAWVDTAEPSAYAPDTSA